MATARATEGHAGRAVTPAHFPCFDGLRAMAASAVLLTHVAASGGAVTASFLGVFFARMDVGVSVFFLLSGFLLYRPFVVAHLRDRPRPATGPYLWRRFLRIYPAYWLVVTIVVYVFADKAITDPKSFVLYYGLFHIYSVGHVLGPLQQSWTLATEVSFYVFLPIFALALRSGSTGSVERRLRREVVGVVVLIAASVAWKTLVLAVFDDRVGQLKTWLPWWLDLFGVGMLLAIGSVRTIELGRVTPLRLDRRWVPAVSWLGALGAFWLVSAGIGTPYRQFGIDFPHLIAVHYLYGLTALGLVLPAVFGPQDRESSHIRRFLTTRSVAYAGVISYGIYLWQEAWIDRFLVWSGQPAFTVYRGDVPFVWHTSSYFSAPWLAFLLAIVGLTLAAATASWYLLERPVLRLKRLVRDGR